MNNSSLEDVTHEDAVAVLKKTQDRVVIVVARVGMSLTDSPTVSPPCYQDAVQSSELSLSLFFFAFFLLSCVASTRLPALQK